MTPESMCAIHAVAASVARETRVISGIPEHRDSMLTEQERAANETVMICCAGSQTDSLVLDL